MNTSRGESGFLEPRNTLRMYGPHMPRSIAIDQLPQFINLPYGLQPATPESFISEGEEREPRRRSRPSEINSVSNDQSANPSPDEIIIKGRGRRSLPVKWSPIPIESPQKTPLRSFIRKTPRKDLSSLRSSPRKRLQLSDTSYDELVFSRKSLINSSPLARKSLETVSESHSGSFSEDSASDLSKSLIDILNSFNEGCPKIKDSVSFSEDNTDEIAENKPDSKCQTLETEMNTTEAMKDFGINEVRGKNSDEAIKMILGESQEFREKLMEYLKRLKIYDKI